jgi:hypothetical protein
MIRRPASFVVQGVNREHGFRSPLHDWAAAQSSLALVFDQPGGA